MKTKQARIQTKSNFAEIQMREYNNCNVKLTGLAYLFHLLPQHVRLLPILIPLAFNVSLLSSTYSRVKSNGFQRTSPRIKIWRHTQRRIWFDYIAGTYKRAENCPLNLPTLSERNDRQRNELITTPTPKRDNLTRYTTKNGCQEETTSKT